jgi:hypothetical protein
VAADGPGDYEVVGDARCGDAPTYTVQPGTVAYITTGGTQTLSAALIAQGWWVITRVIRDGCSNCPTRVLGQPIERHVATSPPGVQLTALLRRCVGQAQFLLAQMR